MRAVTKISAADDSMEDIERNIGMPWRTLIGTCRETDTKDALDRIIDATLKVARERITLNDTDLKRYGGTKSQRMLDARGERMAEAVPGRKFRGEVTKATQLKDYAPKSADSP